MSNSAAVESELTRKYQWLLAKSTLCGAIIHRAEMQNGLYTELQQEDTRETCIEGVHAANFRRKTAALSDLYKDIDLRKSGPELQTVMALHSDTMQQLCTKVEEEESLEQRLRELQESNQGMRDENAKLYDALQTADNLSTSRTEDENNRLTGLCEELSTLKTKLSLVKCTFEGLIVASKTDWADNDRVTAALRIASEY